MTQRDFLRAGDYIIKDYQPIIRHFKAWLGWDTPKGFTPIFYIYKLKEYKVLDRWNIIGKYTQELEWKIVLEEL